MCKEIPRFREGDGPLPFKTHTQALVYQVERVDYTNRDRGIIVTGMSQVFCFPLHLPALFNKSLLL